MNITTWWDVNISDHKNYGENVNFKGKKFVVHLLGEDTKTILDVGCGNGLVYKAIQTMGRKVELYKGIDLSGKFIEACKELYPEAVWEQQDANDLKEADKSYDVVLLYHCLESMREYKTPIQEALRVAKNRVIIVFWKGFTAREDDMIEVIYPYGYTTMFLLSFVPPLWKKIMNPRISKDVQYTI